MSPIEPPDPATLPDAPEPQLSPWRVLIALLLVVVIGGGAFVVVRHTTTTTSARAATSGEKGPWYAPYVDATLTPTVAFQDASANPARDVVLGFVVAGAKAADACTPTWGTYETLDGAATAMDLDRRIEQLHGEGGDAIVSFGGQANSELAVACSDPAKLQTAYQSVVSRYASDTVDFDVEGAALDDTAANARRATAIKAVQDSVRAKGGSLAVWLTLPVTPDGMNPDALAVIRTMLNAKVDLAGVNVMAMDFGVPSAAKDMRAAILDSATSSARQLAAVYAGAGTRLSTAQAWRKFGLTVMIGQNDTDGERVSIADAKAVEAFAAAHDVARVSIWSLNRDAQCGVTFAVTGTHSNVCSGVAQQPLQFSKIFNQLPGTARAGAAAVTTPDLAPDATTATADVPAKSPYPIWQPTVAYREGYKVVWHQAVYVAKYYSQGATPDATNLTAGQSPWRLVGPVLKTDRAPMLPTLPAGTYPAWAATKVFRAGDRVLYHGLPYQASWYTQGDLPGGVGQGGTISPWKALYRIPGEPYDG